MFDTNVEYKIYTAYQNAFFFLQAALENGGLTDWAKELAQQYIAKCYAADPYLLDRDWAMALAANETREALRA